jgi:hypothetical protein
MNGLGGIAILGPLPTTRLECMPKTNEVFKILAFPKHRNE